MNAIIPKSLTGNKGRMTMNQQDRMATSSAPIAQEENVHG
jgi:hypothetical protein